MNEASHVYRTFIQRINSVMDVHLQDENFGVKELAREIGLSKSQLLRKLQSLKGKSTSQFIREYRLEKAMELLQQGAGTASEIAYRVGFSSPTYFSTCFHEYFGYPPGEVKYRQNGDQGAMDTAATHQRTKNGRKRIAWLFGLGLVLVAATSFMVYLDSGRNGAESITSPEILPEEEKSIGVLPFVNLSGNPEYEFICEGMTGAIIDKLTRIESFHKVVPFTTMASFNGKDHRIQEIASELGVTHLLEGNLQKAGDTVKIVIRLIDGNEESYDWTDEYFAAWNLEELFHIQTHVAENVAKKLGFEITSKEYNEISTKDTENIDAYICFQRAGYHKNFYNEPGLNVAEQLYRQAIQLDSSFTEAYIGLGYIWHLRAWQGLHPEGDAISKCLHYLKIALDQGAEDPWAEDVYYSFKFWYEWDFETLEALFQKYSKQGTLLQMPRVADYSVKTGRVEVALRIVEQRIESNPKDAGSRAERLRYLLILNNYTDFAKFVKEEKSLFLDDRDYSGFLAKLYLTLGDINEAKLYADRYVLRKDNYFHNDNIYYNWLNAVLLAKNGNKIASEKFLMEIKEYYNNDDSLGNPCWYLALYYSTIGDLENTIHWLQKSYEQHEVEMTWLYAEPLLKTLKDDPRYLELLRKVGFNKVIPSLNIKS